MARKAFENLDVKLAKEQVKQGFPFLKKWPFHQLGLCLHVLPITIDITFIFEFDLMIKDMRCVLLHIFEIFLKIHIKGRENSHLLCRTVCLSMPTQKGVNYLFVQTTFKLRPMLI